MNRKRSFHLPWKMLPVIFALAWPTMLEQLMQTAVQYIDTAMVGALGTEATAAVGATTTVGWLVGGMVSAFGVGFLAFIARACGAKDQQALQNAVGTIACLTLICSLFITVVMTLAPKALAMGIATEASPDAPAGIKAVCPACRCPSINKLR